MNNIIYGLFPSALIIVAAMIYWSVSEGGELFDDFMLFREGKPVVVIAFWCVLVLSLIDIAINVYRRGY